MSTVEERVQRGAAFLDATSPGWRDAIEPGLLRMQECTHCMLGQLYVGEAGIAADGWPESGYEHAVERHADHADWSLDHGFTTHPKLRDQDESWDALREAWLAVILGPRVEREAEAEVATA